MELNSSFPRYHVKKVKFGNSLAVQWLRLHASIAVGPGLIPGWGTKIPQAMKLWPKINK